MLLGRLATNATQSLQAEVTEMSRIRRKWLSARALPNVYRVIAGAVVVGINIWLDYTPEFQPIVVAVSSPLTLTLSLWLLTKAIVRARLIAVALDEERAREGDNGLC
jgi:uncharacterized protein (DUF983 family)